MVPNFGLKLKEMVFYLTDLERLCVVSLGDMLFKALRSTCRQLFLVELNIAMLSKLYQLPRIEARQVLTIVIEPI